MEKETFLKYFYLSLFHGKHENKNRDETRREEKRREEKRREEKRREEKRREEKRREENERTPFYMMQYMSQVSPEYVCEAQNTP